MKFRYFLIFSFIILGAVSLKDVDDDDVEIVDSYDNTEELIKKFPVINPTTVNRGLETKIQNRLLTGFENWNRGFAAWKKWGTILYTEDSIYNVHGARLSLAQYQAAMDVILKQTDVLMGDFHNMVICDEWCAIYYDMYTKVGDNLIPGTVMEFVKFKDYGDELGTRVVEGWGSTKDKSYNTMITYQGPEEKEIQEKNNNYTLNYEIPEIDDLEKKYPVLYPTNGKGNYIKEIRNIILKGIDSWNKGIDEWMKWVPDAFDNDAEIVGLDEENKNIREYRIQMRILASKEDIKKLYFDSFLICDDWAAIHYRYTSVDLITGEKNCGDRMQFFKFSETNSGLKIVGTWFQ